MGDFEAEDVDVDDPKDTKETADRDARYPVVKVPPRRLEQTGTLSFVPFLRGLVTLPARYPGRLVLCSLLSGHSLPSFFLL